VVMDKTGTLTLGEPRLTDIVPLDGVTERALLQTAAAIEGRSEHPLAKAVARAAAQRGIEAGAVEAFTSLPGRGLLGTVAGR
jgi:cation transport ATPase